ncbi:hypothetical protein B0H14DRAFT_2570159 [Mycena olivaceomarginata]|nr:hypothetical protein B0H14DRAFT_2570159 [Mycena olivaceomarginata]
MHQNAESLVSTMLAQVTGDPVDSLHWRDGHGGGRRERANMTRDKIIGSNELSLNAIKVTRRHPPPVFSPTRSRASSTTHPGCGLSTFGATGGFSDFLAATRNSELNELDLNQPERIKLKYGPVRSEGGRYAFGLPESLSDEGGAEKDAPFLESLYAGDAQKGAPFLPERPYDDGSLSVSGDLPFRLKITGLSYDVKTYTGTQVYDNRYRFVCSRKGTGGLKAYTKVPDWSHKRESKRTDCPCVLIVNEYPGVATVLENYTNEHNHPLGNENLRFNQIPKETREYIAGLLQLHVSPEFILQLIHGGVYSNDDTFDNDQDGTVASRNDFIQLQDIRHIQQGRTG